MIKDLKVCEECMNEKTKPEHIFCKNCGIDLIWINHEGQRLLGCICLKCGEKTSEEQKREFTGKIKQKSDLAAEMIRQDNEVYENEPKKFDEGKAMWTAMPWNALTLCAKGMTHGAKKYGKQNYLIGGGLDSDRCLDAAGRHFSQYLCGEVIDKDSGLPHLTLATCELLMAQEIIIKCGGEENV